MQKQLELAALVGILLTPMGEAFAQNQPGVPVTINYGNSIVVSDKLSDAIFFGVMRSRIVTINVDGETVLVANIDSDGGDRDRIQVSYWWDQKFLLEKKYHCPSKYPIACGRKIVRGIEKASSLLRY